MLRFARFDDFSPNGDRAFELTAPAGEVVAVSLDEVVPALREAEAAARSGRWTAGFVAYEAAPAFDPVLSVRLRDASDPLTGLPLVHFVFFDDYEQVAPFSPAPPGAPRHAVSSWRPSIDRTRYEGSVGEIRSHIGDGDVYQVNYTFRLRAAFGGEPLELYRDLVLAQRGSYGVYLDLGRYHVLSASPERFFRIEDRRITTKPMKGTAARGRWPEEDRSAAAWLVSSEKDRAENLMIVDLLRNDLGRVAEFGTVAVDELFSLERYETVWQLTSKISALLRSDVSVADVFAALFPCGSVTGAPKTRAMDVIAGLEAGPRGVYCGAVGFLSPPDSPWADASFNVAIRTVTVDREEGFAEYGVGGGITWDSSEEGEFEEARAKARLLVEHRPDFELLETLRWDPQSGWMLLDEHFERLRASAAYFGFPCDCEAFRGALDAAVAGRALPARARLLVDRMGRTTVELADFSVPFAERFEEAESVRVEIDDVPVNSQDVFCFHKTTNRRVYTERARRHPSVDDVLLVNERGEITESTIANIVVRHGDLWTTPPLDSGCLPGVMRARLLADGVVKERALVREDLLAADAVALVNSVRGWQRVELS